MTDSAAIGMPAASGWTWTLSIIGLVLVIRAALIPVFLKQVKAQRRMRLLQPDLKKLQDKYKGKTDPLSRQAMAQEQMALYKKHGTNPFSACLPMLIQMPFFFALFQVLSGISTAAGQDEGIGAMSAEQVKQFEESTIFGAPLSASLLHGGGDQTAVWILSIVMILVMTASQFITQKQILARNMSEDAVASPLMAQQKVHSLQPAGRLRCGRHRFPHRGPDLLDHHQPLDHGTAVLHQVGQNGSMTRIAIIGGHGKVALELSRILAADGQEVTSFIRNPDHAADVAATGATPSLLDVENSTTAEIADALRNHDAVVWSAGAGGGSPERTYAVDRDAAIRSIDAAAEAGVGRYVMVSYFGAGPDHGVPADNGFYAYAEAKAAADAYLRGSGLDWTILGPGTLTDGPGNGMIDVDPADASDGTETARANVALVAAAVLGLPATIGRTIEFRDGTLPLAAALQPVGLPVHPHLSAGPIG